ncbi:MAG: transcription termination factor NusA [Bdellovibrionota bacterium]
MQIDLKQVIDAVGKEKNIDKQLLISALKEAVLAAARKHFGDCLFETRFNEEAEEIELIRYRVVVQDDEITNPNKQITYSEAVAMDESLQLGDEVGEALPTEQLGRIAAQSAKQSIVQKVLEAEKEKIVREFRDKKHQIVIGQVRRFDKSDIIIDLGQTEGVLPVREQIPIEKYKIRDKITTFVLDVKKSSRGSQVVLSRAHPEFLIRLFEQEVTEIAEGIVVIQSAARDPGSRSKIAVYSNEPSVDPVGACVGVKGARVQSIVQELRGEKIDIIPYDRDPARFVCNALAPAEPTKVIVNERLHIMEVVVPDDHLSLAIGKRGQNVRLAAQLTGWKVDIRSESKMKELVQEYKSLIAKIPALGEMRAEILVNEGYKDPADISRMDPRSLVKLLRLTPEEAELVIVGAAELATSIEQAQEKQDDELDTLTLATTLDHGQDNESFEAEAAIQDIVAKTRPQPMLDPEKVDIKSVDVERLRYWMRLRGVAEHIAAVLHVAGFTDFSSVANSNPDEVAFKTGLPLKFSGKIHAESTKIANSNT